MNRPEGLMKIVIGQKRYNKIKKFMHENKIDFYVNGFDIQHAHLIVSIGSEKNLELVDRFLTDFQRVPYNTIGTFLNIDDLMYVPNKKSQEKQQ